MTTTVHSRYRAAEGAIITLTRKTTGADTGHVAACDGCGDGSGGGLRTVRDWAQAHAKCRALPAPAALPDGILHRAVTVGGGHIDITTGTATASTISTVSTCTGCREVETFEISRTYQYGNPEQVAIGRAITWTRNHATCPFMPKPEGSR
jgi:hypothetical protein